MKNEILKLLQSNKDYISGEDISKILNISRSAIWKHIKTLKSEGFEIEGISNKGYKLLSCPDIIIENNIQKHLKTNFIAHTIYHYNTLNSTNTKAKELSDKANDGSIVISEIQEGAHGRFDRAWVSPKGGLWFSMILKPIIELLNVRSSLITCFSANSALSKASPNNKLVLCSSLLLEIKAASICLFFSTTSFNFCVIISTCFCNNIDCSFHCVTESEDAFNVDSIVFEYAKVSSLNSLTVFS